MARSATSAYMHSPDTEPIGSRPVVCRLVKGVFENRPYLPKYQPTWDVDTVLDYLAKRPEVEVMSLRH